MRRLIDVATSRDRAGLHTSRHNGAMTDASAVVRSVKADGTWARYRLRSGDVILAVDGQRITDQASLEKALTRVKAGHRPAASFTIARGRHRGTLSLPL